MSKLATKQLARSINTLEYATTTALETERSVQLAKGRKQSLKLLQAIESELKARQANGGRRPSIEDYV